MSSKPHSIDADTNADVDADIYVYVDADADADVDADVCADGDNGIDDDASIMQVAQESEELMQLSSDRLAALLGSNELETYGKEHLVFELIIKWISEDEKSRMEHIALFINTVRFEERKIS